MHDYSATQELDPSIATSFRYTYLLSHFVGAAAILLIIVWKTAYLGGFQFEDPQIEFNFHTVCMVTGMVYLAGNSMLVYRAFRSVEKTRAKKIHASLHFVSMLFSSFGLFAVIDFHNRALLPNFYSLHSWLGITVIVLYFTQSAVSVLIFLFPVATAEIRAKVLPIHTTGGYAIFAMTIAACVAGLTEKALFSMDRDHPPVYYERPPMAWLVNCVGLTLVVYFLIVMHLLTHPDYKRVPPHPGFYSTRTVSTMN